MSKKIIKLKEGDLVKIVEKMVNEQMSSTNPDIEQKLTSNSHENPLAAIKPTEKRTQRPIIDKRPVVNGDIINKKVAVRSSLNKVLTYLGDLIQASGINPETNNLVADIEKVQTKFENLFGDPTVEEPDNVE